VIVNLIAKTFRFRKMHNLSSVCSVCMCMMLCMSKREALVGREESGERVLSAGTRLLLFPTFFGFVCSSLHFSHPSLTQSLTHSLTHSQCSSRDTRLQTWLYVAKMREDADNFLEQHLSEMEIFCNIIILYSDFLINW